MTDGHLRYEADLIYERVLLQQGLFNHLTKQIPGEAGGGESLVGIREPDTLWSIPSPMLVLAVTSPPVFQVHRRRLVA